MRTWCIMRPKTTSLGSASDMYLRWDLLGVLAAVLSSNASLLSCLDTLSILSPKHAEHTSSKAWTDKAERLMFGSSSNRLSEILPYKPIFDHLLGCDR